jgi:hypothetical protein
MNRIGVGTGFKDGKVREILLNEGLKEIRGELFTFVMSNIG